eukprot:scaffold918_cov126-Cylindrotheca_fusiformis.AAC.50
MDPELASKFSKVRPSFDEGDGGNADTENSRKSNQKAKRKRKEKKENAGGFFGFGGNKKDKSISPQNKSKVLDLEEGSGFSPAPARSPNSMSESENGFNHISEERYEVGQDVYGLIFVSPVTSPSFIFASVVVSVKFALFTFLAADLYQQTKEDDGLFSEKEPLIRATQFLLLPIAIALQEDLIYVYTRIANIRYTKDITNTTPSATKSKFVLSFMLRLLDGIFSLTINFVLILITDTMWHRNFNNDYYESSYALLFLQIAPYERCFTGCRRTTAVPKWNGQTKRFSRQMYHLRARFGHVLTSESRRVVGWLAYLCLPLELFDQN